MEEVRQRNIPYREGISIHKILGRKVLAKNGKEIGKVSDVYVLGNRLEVEGIRVHRGILKEDQFIGSGLIASINPEAVVLADVPVTEIKGLSVYDSKGSYVGKVKDVSRIAKTNYLKKLEVDRGLGKSALMVPADQVDHVAENVFLSTKVES